MELHLNIKISTPEADEFIREFTNSDDFIIVNTSGSTGTPKTIHLPKSDMIRSAKGQVLGIIRARAAAAKAAAEGAKK